MTGNPTQQDLARLVEIFTEMREEMAAARKLIASLNGVRRSGLIAREIINGASIRLSTSAGKLGGWAFHETAGAAARLNIRDGSDTNGGLLVPISLSANESTRDFPTKGISFGAGIYVEIVSGAVEGTVYLDPAIAP